MRKNWLTALAALAIEEPLFNKGAYPPKPKPVRNKTFQPKEDWKARKARLKAERKAKKGKQ